MMESQLGSGESIYLALEADDSVIQDGPLQGVKLHVQREVHDWVLPESMSHTSGLDLSDAEIRSLVGDSYEESIKTGMTYVKPEILAKFYERSKAEIETGSSGYQAAFETQYVIKGLSFLFPHQTQQIIEKNITKAFIGSLCDSEVPSSYRAALVNNLIPMRLSELYYFFDSIDEKFAQREDRSQIGTSALIDEIERLTTHVMNERWEVVALPAGDESEAAQPYSVDEDLESQDKPTSEDINEAVNDLVDSIGSRRILEWNMGPTLDTLGRFALGTISAGKDGNPMIDIRKLLIEKSKNSSGSFEEGEALEIIRKLQDIGHMSSQYIR